MNPAQVDPAYATTDMFHHVVIQGRWGAGLIAPVLVGPAARIKQVAERAETGIGRLPVVDVAGDRAAALISQPVPIWPKLLGMAEALQQTAGELRLRFAVAHCFTADSRLQTYRLCSDLLS